MMREEVLMIGDVKVFSTPVVLKCYGLGSCVGLFVKDRITGITGGAHIFFPDHVEADKTVMRVTVSASDSVKLMLEQMKGKGACLNTCRAKITGGSKTLRFNTVGSRNTSEVVRSLIDNKIFIAAMDVGGNTSRTATFDAASGEMTVRHLEENTTKIF